MYRKSVLYCLLLAVLCSCHNNFEYRPLSYYHIDTTALQEGDTIEILYSGGGPLENKDKKFFYHLIVINANKPEDTVNVFVPDISSIRDGKLRKTFAPENSASYKTFMNMDELSDLLAKENVNIDDLPVKSIDKVLINTEYERANDNHYRAITGMLTEYIADIPQQVRQAITDSPNLSDSIKSRFR